MACVWNDLEKKTTGSQNLKQLDHLLTQDLKSSSSSTGIKCYWVALICGFFFNLASTLPFWYSKHDLFILYSANVKHNNSYLVDIYLLIIHPFR